MIQSISDDKGSFTKFIALRIYDIWKFWADKDCSYRHISRWKSLENQLTINFYLFFYDINN